MSIMGSGWWGQTLKVLLPYKLSRSDSMASRSQGDERAGNDVGGVGGSDLEWQPHGAMFTLVTGLASPTVGNVVEMMPRAAQASRLR